MIRVSQAFSRLQSRLPNAQWGGPPGPRGSPWTRSSFEIKPGPNVEWLARRPAADSGAAPLALGKAACLTGSCAWVKPPSP